MISQLDIHLCSVIIAKKLFMKNLYFLAAALFCSTISAQNQISFENAEGYQLGSIQGQNAWQITDDGDGNFVQNQMVTDEKSSNGTFSFKNGYTDEYGGQFFPIIGAQKEFAQPLDYNDATVSFDVLVTETEGSNFEMSAYGISTTQEYYPVFDLAFDWEGTLKVVSNIDYDMEDTGFTWEANRWYAIKVKVSATEIKYFIDGALIYTTPNFTQIDLLGMNFLHDNYSGDAYIDNIKINEVNMAVSSVKKGNIAVYPNPVKNNLNLNLPNGEKVSLIQIYNMAGQNVLTNNGSTSLNLENLKAGTYIITVTNTKGSSYSSKFIKE